MVKIANISLTAQLLFVSFFSKKDSSTAVSTSDELVERQHCQNVAVKVKMENKNQSLYWCFILAPEFHKCHDIYGEFVSDYRDGKYYLEICGYSFVACQFYECNQKFKKYLTRTIIFTEAISYQEA